MTHRYLRLFALALAATLALTAATKEKSSGLTYTKDVAPMPLLSYKQVRPWAAAIKEKVLSRTMPPWLADPHYGEFKNDRRMTQAEIDTIARWADSGAAEGNPQDLPKLPDLVEEWSIGKPEMAVSLLEEVDVPAEGVAPYKYYRVPSNFTEDKWVEAAEIRAGNRSLAHHVIVFVQEPAPTVKPASDSGVAPGAQPKVYPPGTAKLVITGSCPTCTCAGRISPTRRSIRTGGRRWC